MRQKITSRPFGTLADGTQVTEYTLINERGSSVSILDYGVTVRTLCVRDRKGELRDVVLGFDTIEEYLACKDYVGPMIGRCANRIGGAAFTLNGVEYRLAKNDGENTLHGGACGFDRRMWSVEEAPGGSLYPPREIDAPGVRRYDVRDAVASLVFSRVSPDGEEGYPGNLKVSVGFTFTDDDVLKIVYDAVSDRDTVVSLTNHSYFNLDGGNSVLSHRLQISADGFTEVDGNCLPTGRILPVDGTPMDFRKGKPIGEAIDAQFEQLPAFGGYDHNFVLSDHHAAELWSPESGILMQIWTDLPGLQICTANKFTVPAGKGGRARAIHDAIVFETQMFPDAIHHPDFPSPILRAGEKLHTETKYLFGIRQE